MPSRNKWYESFWTEFSGTRGAGKGLLASCLTPPLPPIVTLAKKLAVDHFGMPLLQSRVSRDHFPQPSSFHFFSKNLSDYSSLYISFVSFELDQADTLKALDQISDRCVLIFVSPPLLAASAADPLKFVFISLNFSSQGTRNKNILVYLPSLFPRNFSRNVWFMQYLWLQGGGVLHISRCWSVLCAVEGFWNAAGDFSRRDSARWNLTRIPLG